MDKAFIHSSIGNPRGMKYPFRTSEVSQEYTTGKVRRVVKQLTPLQEDGIITRMKPRVLFPLFLILQLVAGHFDREACGKDKHCIFAPTGCEERNDCSQMFSYNLADDGWVDMEMFFTNGKPTDAYIAVGFSDDQEMGREPVTQCVFPSGGKPTVAFSYNVGKSNAPPTKEDDLNAERDNLRFIHGHKGDDGMYCHVRQKSTTGESEFAPPLNQTFHILLATGPAQNERAIGIHGLDPKTSSFPYIHKDQVNVMTTVKRAAAEPEEASTTTTEAPAMTRQTKFWLVRVHGILMIFSWLVLIISAVLAARYLRDHFPSSAPCGLKWWFHIHRTLNVLSVPIILISTLLIFIAKEWTWKGPSAGKTSAENTSAGSIHSLLGTIAILVAVLQPLLALLRCQPDTGARPIFNWTHRSLGILGVVCAVIAILIATNSFLSLWGDAAWCLGVMIFYIVVSVIAIVLHEVLSYMKNKAPRKTSMEMRNRSSHRYDDSGRVINNPPKVVNSKPLYGVVGAYVLYFLFSLCVAALLIVMLSV